MAKRRSLADMVAEMSNPQPRDYDPEDAQVWGQGAKVTESFEYEDEDDVPALSRKSRLRDLDAGGAAYRGARVSRNDLMDTAPNRIVNDNAEFSSEEDEDEDEDEEEHDGHFDAADDSGEDEEEEQEDDDGDDDDDDEEEEAEALAQELQDLEQQDNAALFSMSRAEEEEIEKGRHVRAQQSLWDSMLNLRIRMQKALVDANRLPVDGTDADRPAVGLRAFCKQSDEVKSAAKAAQQEICSLLANVCELQTAVRAQNPTVPVLELPEDSSTQDVRRGDFDREALTQALSQHHDAFLKYSFDVIDKWNRRTQLTSANLSAANKFKAINQSITSQIERSLADKESLVKRTKIIRFDGALLGRGSKRKRTDTTANGDEYQEDAEETSDHIFDDTDFYQQLLHSVISSADADDNGLTTAEHINNVRSARRRARKKVDRRASKGRKIRYTVHPKLVSFMAPQVRHDENFLADELFAGLFGGPRARATPDAQ